jgi:hypothetical protein
VKKRKKILISCFKKSDLDLHASIVCTRQNLLFFLDILEINHNNLIKLNEKNVTCIHLENLDFLPVFLLIDNSYLPKIVVYIYIDSSQKTLKLIKTIDEIKKMLSPEEN